MKINETSMPQNFSKYLFENLNYDLAPEHTDKMLDIIFTATAEFLNSVKRKECPAAFKFEKIDGSIAAAAIIQYFPNEDESKPGNWSLVWTFDEIDIPEGAFVSSIKDPQTHSYFRAIAGEKWSIKFKDPASIITLMICPLEQVKKWLDENAKEDEEVSIEQDAVFQARVAVEGGVKVFAIEPAGEIKVLIKDDAAIEK